MRCRNSRGKGWRLLMLAGLAVACSRERPLDEQVEAQLQRGDTAQAIALVEQALRDQPGNAAIQDLRVRQIVAHTLAKTFHALGYAAVRFNFRGVGQSEGAFDDGAGETDDALAALAHAVKRLDGHAGPLPVVLAGFSFGTYVQTRVARSIHAERLVLVGPAVQRFADVAVPADTIVIHGEHDEIVPLADVLDWARPHELPVVVFPGCGHFFHGRLVQLQRTIAGMWHGHAVAPGV